MIHTQPAAGEEARLAALAALNVLDTPPEERFDRVTKLCTRLFGVPMAAVALIDKDRWFAKSLQGLTVRDIPRTQAFCDYTIREPETLLVEDLQVDPRFSANALVTTDPHIRFYAGQPLEAPGGHRVGTLCLMDIAPRTLSDGDQALLRDLASWVQKELAVDEELERAAEVQRGLLPTKPPALGGYDLAGRCLPSREVGGDLYDWYPIPGGAALTVADVMGKGMPAAIVMATLRAMLRAGSRTGDVVGAVGLAASALESDFEGAGVFATLFHAALTAADGTLRYVDAGHGLARVVTASGSVAGPDARGLPAGAVPDTVWTEGRLDLAPGDTFVLFSDGVLDLHPDQAAVEAAVAAAAGAATAAEVADRLVAPARDRYREDDVTVLVVRRLA